MPLVFLSCRMVQGQALKIAAFGAIAMDLTAALPPALRLPAVALRPYYGTRPE
jgi:hypothetical protein